VQKSARICKNMQIEEGYLSAFFGTGLVSKFEP